MNRQPLRSVLYVDDDPDIREVVQMAFETLSDVLLRTVDGGEAALASLRGERPDMVLLDVMMPGLDGPATLQRMRAELGLGAIPVLFMTAKSLPHELEHLRRLGSVGIIGKPFDPMQLPRTVQTHWESLDEP